MQYWAAGERFGDNVRNPMNHCKAVEGLQRWYRLAELKSDTRPALDDGDENSSRTSKRPAAHAHASYALFSASKKRGAAEEEAKYNSVTPKKKYHV